MEAIHIPSLLKLPEQTEVIEVNECLTDLETLTPVRGRLQVTHRGNYLDVSGFGSTIITLTCDRCLQKYNHRLNFETSEIIWLDESGLQEDSNLLEREIAFEDLVETLSPQGYFQPDTWLYEQLCLAIPHRQLCGQQCSGIQVANNGSESPTDRRWEALEALKRQLSG